ncbi:sodium-dependent transporter [Marinobacter confluentis]|uniref:Sodium-dependent transporter n=1 Tax=Marinobacter confluentis TaxID=1697557 RepID=A0A4Z1C5I4_9GAMM|nr:sodium-dependent transporter [Marinobacter confluentis]TGN40560.1 sodium-dependent transporter [Marinobacter confluentis]
MPTPYETHIGSWTRPTTFFWAALGATFGLANVWQFPYLASQNGGGLFVLLYLGCLLLITLPLMVTETTMGRYARHGLVLAMDGFVRSARCSRWWLWAGRLGILAAFLVLSFTAVFGAISLAYVFFSAIGRFINVGAGDASDILAGLVSSPDEYRAFMAWHGFFLLLVIWVSMQGVVQGVERAVRAVTPIMVLFVAVFCGFAAWQGEFGQAADAVLSFNAAALSWESLNSALFHAFFTLGLGMGVWTLFGAYTPAETRLKRTVLAVVLMDTLVAIGAGLAIYSVVPGDPGMSGERGFDLLFLSLPVAMSDLPGSQFLLAAVYLLMVMVVWSTSLALLEPIVGWFREWTGAPRALSVFMIGLAVWLLGLGSLFSFNVWSGLEFAGGTFFRWLELFTGGLLVPLVSILISVFAGWYLTRSLALRMLGNTPGLFSRIWLWVMRLVLPVVVAYIGLQYSFSGVKAMCDGAPGIPWCEPQLLLESPVFEQDAETGADPAGESAEESGPRTEDGQAPPSDSQPDDREQPQEDVAPGNEDVLFQSA